ncbi:MAG: acyl-CoA thioesterase/bile acid-CoA:amino acid N-acyltransferase family protein [Pseudomonadota bacterium]
MQVHAATNDLFATAAPIRLSGATPQSHVALRARIVDDDGVAWSGWAKFEVDSDGGVDTGRDAPLDGTYDGADAGGLFWSMRPSTWADDQTRADYINTVQRDPTLPLQPTLDVLKPLTVTVSADASDGQIQTTLTRRRLLPGTEVIDDLPGRLRGKAFIPPDANGAGVLVLGGSEGGLMPARAASLSAEGFTTLALAYFDYEDLPTAAVDLPLAYLKEALDWLGDRTNKVAIWGVSRGSEAAVLVAHHFASSVDGLIAWLPSPVANAAIDMAAGRHFADETRAMWSLGGTSLPGVALGRASLTHATGTGDRYPGRAYAGAFAARWRESDVAATLPVHQIDVPVLLVAGEDDQLWPAAYGARELAARLERECPSVAVTLRVCPDAGHMIGVPNEIRPCSDVLCWPSGYNSSAAELAHYGGTPAGNAAAARSTWRTAVDFLQELLVVKPQESGP